MSELILKVPKQLEKRMKKVGWVDWSKLAIRSLSEKVEDIEEFELERKIAEISEISHNDKREVKKSLAKSVEVSCDKTFEDLESGKLKPMTLDDLDKLIGLK